MMPEDLVRQDMSERAEIEDIVMLGDSLSDRGTLPKKLPFGFMSVLSGLSGKSPDGRFTNGLVWDDHLSAKMASDFISRELRKRERVDDTEISDAVLAHDPRIMDLVRNTYTLDNDQFVNYKGRVWIRSYCEGGLMSHDYSWALSDNIIRFFTRLIVATLAEMRQKLFDYDKKNNISAKQKAKTLVLEWSGANDLVTVNAKPSMEEVDKAIAARIDNVKQLINAGYRHFVLFNLPNLALTPRFQAKTAHERAEAEKCSLYFNAQLQKRCAELKGINPNCSIDVFDIGTTFENIYNHPERFSFDRRKRTTPYVNSPDFDNPSDGISAASGYMFYDDLHPSADLHALLATYVYDQLKLKFQFQEPKAAEIEYMTEEELLACFRKKYEEKVSRDRCCFFSCGSSSSSFDYKKACLEDVLRRAVITRDPATLDILVKLGWVNNKGELGDRPLPEIHKGEQAAQKIPVLVSTMHRIAPPVPHALRSLSLP